MTAWLMPKANPSENENIASLDSNKNDDNDQCNQSASAIDSENNSDSNVNSNDESKN